MKLNRHYLSFLEAMGFNKPDPNRPDNYSFYGHRYSEDYSSKSTILLSSTARLKDKTPKGNISGQIKGSFRPWQKLGKELTNFATPYYSTQHVINDLIQPYRGIVNILVGSISIVAGAFLLPFALLAMGIYGVLQVAALVALLSMGIMGVLGIPILPLLMPFIIDAILELTVYARSYTPLALRPIYPLSWIIEGIGNLVRGVVELVTTPLTWMLKVPYRAYKTHNSDVEMNLEDKKEIQRLVTETQKYVNGIKSTVPDSYGDVAFPLQERKAKIAANLYEIDRKTEKSIARGWFSKHDSLNGVSKARHQLYINNLSPGFFSSSKPLPEEDINTFLSYYKKSS